MKKILLCLLLSWSTITLSAQESPGAISLQEAVEWGMQYNLTLQNADRELQKAYKKKWETLSIGFPQIRANLSYQNNIELPVSLIPAEFFGGQAGEFSEITFGTKQSAIGSVELSQLLFDGSYVVGVMGIKHFIQVAENVLEKTQLEVRRTIVDSYLNAITIEQSIDLLQKNIDITSKDIEEIHQLFRAGFVEEENVEQLQLTLASLESQLDYNQNIAELSLKTLKLLLGLELNTDLKLTDNLEGLTLTHLVLKEESSGYENNIDLRIAEGQITSEELLYKLERSKSLPSFEAFINGMYMGNNDTFGFTDKDQKWFGSSAFGVRVQIPIFSSFGRTASSQKAKISLEQAKVSFKEAKSKIFVEYEQAKNNYQLAIKNFNNAQNQLDLATRIEKKNKTKFFEGLASSFDLRQAQVQLFNRQQNYILSMKDIVSKKTALDIIINNPK